MKTYFWVFLREVILYSLILRFRDIIKKLMILIYARVYESDTIFIIWALILT